jgi:hypothetical protein
VEVSIIEYTEAEHNTRNGIDRGSTSTAIDQISASSGKVNSFEEVASSKPGKGRKSIEGKDTDQMYYFVSCKDNGCGIPEKNIGKGYSSFTNS